MEVGPANLTLVYRELKGKRTIRLLRFLPGPEQAYSFVYVDLDKAPPYVALSYTWGTQAQLRTVIVDGQRLSIHNNLADALSGMYSGIVSSTMLFWADAICINQRDIQERSSQVRLMDALYRGAERVAIWLGNAFEGSDLLFDKMKIWDEDIGETTSLAKTMSMGPSISRFYGVEGSSERRAWGAHRVLCAHEWWNRAWIVQEATALDSTSVYLVCGSKWASWKCFRTTLQIGYSLAGVNQTMGTNFNQTMALRIDGFREQRECGDYLRLLEVLQHIRCYDSTDPRDKVYASLGMACDISNDEIIPDYSKSVLEVFTEVVQWSLKRTNSDALDFLGYVVRPAPSSQWLRDYDPRLPSWIPDWKIKGNFPALRKYTEWDVSEGARSYNASGNHELDATIKERNLSVRGLHFDEIIQVLTIVEDNLSESGASTEKTWIPTSRLQGKYQATNETINEAFNRTIMADIGNEVDGPLELSRPYSMDWSLEARDPTELAPADVSRRHNMLVHMKLATFARRFFWTKRGYMGLAPAAAEVGDEVCVLFGGQVLYVVRPFDETKHEFIGECYLHGWMDGEAVRGLGEDGESFGRMYVFE
ncbi:hypothetical protein P154DRAFT_158008 [Amniculicola lignicola CBS 123094]|uniref:Heterokaryon incompatibility domain-containing protein n=1 Tax=Amniculicola lignicola CBS 123094 TaxID=1392246 RepID=A0A6A5WIL1_9PLEO|nr:hypothetical protein P154DRAFT_158008 [Amniculicola lignicola CBS 123094]